MKQFFDQLQPLEPIPTQAEPVLHKMPDIKCVAFDIYGTLLISSSGDISSSELFGKTAAKAFSECQIKINPKIDVETAGKLILTEYKKCILRHHDKKKDQGIPHPEVDILKIWQEVIYELTDDSIIVKRERIDFEQLSIIFEALSNSVYPMPGMIECLQSVSNKKLELGIVSNAQYFTPMFLNYFFSQKDYKKKLPYFNQDLIVYSYETGRAKPDTYLYELLQEKLKQKGIAAEECLYIGNDMLNDIYPAQKTGFKTAFFAGDVRSMRLRSNMNLVKDTSPNLTLTELKQLEYVLD